MFRNRFALLLLLSAAVFAGDLTGKWSGSFDEVLPDGSTRNAGGAYMDLKIVGTTVTGTAGPDEGRQSPISNGKLEGKKLTFDVAHDEGPTMKFDLVFDGESIKGGVSAEQDGRKRAAKLDLKRKQ